MAVRQPPKDFRQSFVPSKDLKRLLDFPIHKRKAPLLLNFIPTYKSVLPDVPRKKKKKSLSPPSATTPQIASTSWTDQGSTSDPSEQPSTSVPYLVPISQRSRRRRMVSTAEMGRTKLVVKDLLASIPSSVDDQPAQTFPPPKPKRVKKAQPKAKADAIPLPFPPAPTPSEDVGESDAEDEIEEEEDEALIRKSKDADGDEEGDLVPIEAVPEIAPADIPSEVKTVEVTLQEIDAEIAAEKEAEVRLLDLPIHKRKAPLLLNFIPTYKSVLPDVPRKKKKKSLSPPSATTPQIASTSRTDQGSTSDSAEQPSTSVPYLVPISQRCRRRRMVSTAEMGRAKLVVKDLLASISSSVDDQPAQTLPLPKPKRVKKAQPKAKDEEGDLVSIEAVPEITPADIPSEVKTVEVTLQEIDAKIAAEKEAEVVSDLQQSGGEEP
ncbi:uncharacterized protein LOC114266469 [Camellia sinensis]|uniref:uncharacterized protein LOC114266469 n=1 Tax=Camellia sinensis TaxID=4442 RepID=UPI001036872A|nr:uncharacterized protein LOC114266469 [Camellia sinensis]